MSTNTPNYNLEKPNEEEFYDVNVQNGNMDKIDSALKTLAVEVANGVTEEDLTAIDTKLDGINQGVNEINGKSDQIKQGVDNISAQIANKNTGKVLKSKTYTTNGTFTVPAGVTEVYITGGGAGGGGGGAGNAGGNSGGAGGVSSFGNLLTLNGGSGGYALVGGGNTLSTPSGGPGGSWGANAWNSSHPPHGGNGGWFSGGYGTGGGASTHIRAGDGAYCSGGGAAGANGGGAGDFVIKKEVTVTPNTSHIISVGIGGKGGVGNNTGGAQNTGGNGGNGLLIIEWWE